MEEQKQMMFLTEASFKQPIVCSTIFQHQYKGGGWLGRIGSQNGILIQIPYQKMFYKCI